MWIAMEDQTDLNEPVGQAHRKKSWVPLCLGFLGILAVLLGMGFLTAALTGTAQEVAFGATALLAFFGLLTVFGMVGSRRSQEPLLSSHREWREFLSDAPLEDFPEFRTAAKDLVIKDNISFRFALRPLVMVLHCERLSNGPSVCQIDLTPLKSDHSKSWKT